MNKLQFYLLLGISLSISALFFVQIILSRELRSSSQQLATLQTTLQQGQQAYLKWKQIITRVAQLSPKDQALKDILTRQDVHVTFTPETPVPRSGESNPATNGVSASVPVPTAMVPTRKKHKNSTQEIPSASQPPSVPTGASEPLPFNP